MKRLAQLLSGWMAAFPALAFALAVSTAAHAQNIGPINAITVSSCGSVTYTAGLSWPIVQDTTGHLCTNASGGGGGGAITAPLGSQTLAASVAVTACAGCILDLQTGSPILNAIEDPVPACVIGTSCNWMGNPAPFANETTAAYVTVTGSATLVAAARTGAYGTGRGRLILVSNGVAVINCGGSGVTTTSGTRLPAVDGASATLDYQGAEYCISTGSNVSVSVTELY